MHPPLPVSPQALEVDVPNFVELNPTQVQTRTYPYASTIASECLLLSLSKSTPESLTLGADLPIQGDKSQKRQRKASTCKACGASGHNSANPRCPAKKQRTGGSGSIAGNGGGGGSSTSSRGVEVNEDYLSGSEGEEEKNDEECEQYLDPSWFDENGDEPSEIYDPINEVGGSETTNVVNLSEDKWEDIDVLETSSVRTRQGLVAESPESTLPTFESRNHGPSLPANPPTTILGYFQLFIDVFIIGKWVAATNAHGRANAKGRLWKDIDSDEMKAFLAIVLHFGVVRYPERNYPWRKDQKYGSDWIKSTMSFNRFDAILRNWSYEDTTKESLRSRGEKNKENCFWTVQGFLDLLAGSCLRYYNPCYKANVDEGVFPFKGRHRARCYNPGKPEKWHFKSYCLNCSVTGYLMNFFMYQGRDEKVLLHPSQPTPPTHSNHFFEQRPPGQTASEYPVLRLLKPLKFQEKNMILATDNWYTSIFLAIKLLAMGIFLFGTCRTNKVGVPKNKVFPKTGVNKKERGEYQCSVTKILVKGMEHFLYFISWMDNKPVHFISTIATKSSEVTRVIKEGTKYVGRENIPIPTIAMNYNAAMGGTDRFDQKVSYYRTTIKTKRWQTRIFTHFIHCAVVNAHILYCIKKGLNRGDDGFSLLSFIGLLVDELAAPQRKKGTFVGPTESPLQYPGLHFPCIKSSITLTNGKRKECRQLCRVCNDRTNSFCKRCKVPLCFSTEMECDDSCFESYHS